jgi:hypothetical protein
MVEEENKNGTPSPIPPMPPTTPEHWRINPFDPAIPGFFTNNSKVIVKGSEVSIVFWQDIDVDGVSQRAACRLTMTRTDFFIFVSYCQKHVDFLTKIFGNAPPSIEEVSRNNPSLVKSAIRDLCDSLGIPHPPSVQDEADVNGE